MSEIITQENYRAYDAINYSKLSALSKNPKDVNTDRVWNDGIQSGSMIDTLCFDGEDKLFEEYYISALTEKDMPSDTIKSIINMADNFSDEELLRCANVVNYGQTWNPPTIIRKIKEAGEKYINELEYSKGKKIISLEFYTSLYNAVQLLKSDHKTREFFIDNDFQVPLTTHLRIEETDIPFKCLLDIKDEKQNIIIADLKYSSRPLRDFPYDFIKWRYDLQASLYSNIVENITKKDVTFYNLVYSAYDNHVFKFKVHPETLYAGKFGGSVGNRKYKGWLELTKEYLWHQKHNVWDLPYELCVNSELLMNPYE